MKKVSKNIKDTEKIAQDFLSNLMSKAAFDIAVVVGLSGDLGTGKTTFTQFIAKNLGIKTKIKSPTFVIIKRYKISPVGCWTPDGASFKNFFHIDAYRLKNEKELLYLGWKEIVSNKDNLIFIEWPENVAKIIPKKYHKVSIKHTREGHRKFKFSGVGHLKSLVSNTRK